MIRPEARARIHRFREAIIGGGVAALGLWWAIGSLGLLKWMGVALALIGAAVAWQGVQRARIRVGTGGVGVVQIDERQVIYLAPVGGGFASLDLIHEISIARDMAGLPVWRFRTGMELLTIPVSAEGSEQLFDAMAVLPDIDIPAAIRAVNTAIDARNATASSDRVVIWSRKVVPLH
ncbi:hypothetical protein [Aliiroseovarius crassostreae]|uniref:hypothetical protein n=1 Tax=Aliiroseovarius crassostreae TaxID=154981 RepID=UPI0021FB2F3E|nr:hypothetical protein [Aliiroseovarius crassostreae]UWQ08309.1 hypothetical protein K3X25_01515 [Aliiroseovarius crassostreae]